MKPNPSSRLQHLLVSGLTTALLAAATTGTAAILAPYNPDAATLHLWHMDANAVPVPDAASGGTNLVSLRNGATLGDASFTGFGATLNTMDGGQDLFAATNKDAFLSPSTANPPGNVAFPYCDATSGAFTLEALVWIGFDPTKNLGTTANGGNNRNAMCQIMTGESTANGGRIFQFRICPTGVAPGGAGNPATAPQPLLTFENIRAIDGKQQPTIFAAIPTTGPDAIVSNNWYHVAVTYNGVPDTADNIKFYWTLVDASRTAASQIPVTSVQTTLNGPNPLGSANTPFVIGNTARNVATAGANFLGRIDEVRVSKVERPAFGMLFGTPEVVIFTQPSSTTVAVGQPASFSVGAGGEPPLSYQWRTNGIPIPGATNSVYSLASAQFSDALNYDVVVTNRVSARTSDPAQLTVRTAINLTWAGFADWDTNNINWDTNADTVADTAYIDGDNARFDGQGSSFLYIPARLRPSAVVVNSAMDYTFSTFTGGGWDGNMGLRKTGAGTLVLETINAYTGPTVIESGVLQVGSTLGQGTIGSGPVTNSGGLVFGSTAGGTFSYITGTGGVTNNAAGAVSFTGTNTLSGPLVLNAGSAIISGEAAKGNHSEITLTAATTPYTTLNVGGGVTYGAGVPLSLLGTTASPDARCQLNAATGTNVVNGPITLTGDGAVNVSSATGAELDLNGNLDGSAFTGILILRGTGTNVANGKIQVGYRLGKTDAGTWTINGTNNSWVRAEVAGGTLRMGANGVVPANSELLVNAGTLDLAGYNQMAAFLTCTNTASPFALNPAGVIGSSSTSADSVLTLNSAAPDNIFVGTIRDSVAGGTRKVGLTLAGGGTLTLTNLSTYSGDTTISAGTLVLSNAASIGNSANIILADGATVSAELRTDGTLTLNPAQTLKGNGAFNVLGNLVSTGTIELKLNKAGTTLTGDTLRGLNQITYGGTLKLNLSGDALGTSDSFKLFYAGSYAGSFAGIVPVAPAAGLAWDTSTLATDGTLRVKTAPLQPVISGFSYDGAHLILAGTNGVQGGSYAVLSSTNVTAPLSEWTPVQTGQFGVGGTFNATNAVAPSEPQRFYLLRVQ